MGTKHFTQKQKLVILKSASEIGVKQAAKLAGITTSTLYEWKRKLDKVGEEAFLAYKPQRPGRGVKKITPEQRKDVLGAWEKSPGFGPGQVRNQLRRQGKTISIKTVRKIMESEGYKPRGRKPEKKECHRFEASRPLELAQMDILEFFINKLKVYLILLLDDFSRFILGWSLLEQTSIDAVIDLVDKAVNRYGKMEELLTDRGFVFYSWRGVNRFEKYLENERIDHTHARAHHPQTLGKVEACNRRIKNELIDQQKFLTAHEAVGGISDWVDHYNYKRSHQGIGGLLVPAERFHGQADKIMNSINKNIDITTQNCYTPMDVERSIVNLVSEPDGKITLYLLGQPVLLTGGSNDRESDIRGSGDSDSGAPDREKGRA
jgi:transposase InsO family protein